MSLKRKKNSTPRRYFERSKDSRVLGRIYGKDVTEARLSPVSPSRGYTGHGTCFGVLNE